jgi:excisionase family DNA binding protein
MEARLLTLLDVAGELACSLATVRRRVCAGELPVVRDGRLVRVRSCDLDRYVAERVRRPVQQPGSVAVGVELEQGWRLWD